MTVPLDYLNLDLMN